MSSEQSELINKLISMKTETKNIDYKEKMNWENAASDQKLKIIKDILAMANTQDGGKIVFGIRDDDYEFVGLDDNELASFDQTKINEYLHKYSDPKHSCQVYKYSVDGKNLVLIDVPEFDEVPIICKTNAGSSIDSKQILKGGQIYIRTQKASSEAIPSSQEMRDLVRRSVIKKGDELLNNIKYLLNGETEKLDDTGNKSFAEEIEEAAKYINDNIGEGLAGMGSWEVIIYPLDYSPERIGDQKKLKDLISKSEVMIRGWNFPHTDSHGAAGNFDKGVQSHTIWNRYREGYRAYKSGLFFWKRALWEDIEGFRSRKGSNVLSVIGAIWSLTEFILFAYRYYQDILQDNDKVRIKVSLNGIKNRVLDDPDRQIHIRDDYYKSLNESTVFEKVYPYIDIKLSHKEIAANIAKSIILIFNGDELTGKFICDWQTRFLERKF